MAKSTRSKVKRSFRAKKREEGVYAANEAARLQRLSAKLAAVRDAEKPEVDEEEEDIKEASTGWCWFTFFGLLDPDTICTESMEIFQSVLERPNLSI